MMKIITSNLQLTFAWVVSFALWGMSPLSYASSSCQLELLKKLEERGHDIIECVIFEQPDKRKYLSVIDTYSDEDGGNQSRIRHYISEGNVFKILFSVENQGEAFLPLSHGGSESSLQVIDINGDGKKEVIFRSYIVPSALIRMHQFDGESMKVESLGMIDTGFQQAEFYPFIVSEAKDRVELEKGKIKLINADAKTTYVWQKNAFYIAE